MGRLFKFDPNRGGYVAAPWPKRAKRLLPRGVYDAVVQTPKPSGKVNHLYRTAERLGYVNPVNRQAARDLGGRAHPGKGKK